MARRTRPAEPAQADVRSELVEHLRTMERRRAGREHLAGQGGLYCAPYRRWIELLESGATVTLPVIYLPADLRGRHGLDALQQRRVTITPEGAITS